MQPVGQALAQLVGLWVLLGFDRSSKLQTLQCGLNTAHHEECRQAVDGIWRIVIGSGAVPALLAIIFRFFLFDCGLYSLEVRDKPAVAIWNTQRVYGTPLRAGGTRGLDNAFPMQALNQNGHHLQTVTSPRSMPVQFSKRDLHDYFIRDGNWHYLFGAAMTWFLLDVSFYGLSLDNRRTLSDMWATSPPVPIDERLACWHSSIPGGTSTVPQWQVTGIPAWQTDVLHPCATIYHVLVVQAKQYLLTVSIASLAGSICFIVFANRLPRRHWLTASFLILAVFLLITGGVYYTVRRTAAAPATVVFVAIHHFVFNFGSYQLALKKNQWKMTLYETNKKNEKLERSALTYISHRRCQHPNLHHPRRNLSNLLPMYLPRHLRRSRQTRQYLGRAGRVRHQLGLRERFKTRSHLPLIWLRGGLWGRFLMALPAGFAARY